MRIALSAAAAFAATASVASADVLIDQQHDFINGLASEIGTIVSHAQTADDFTIENQVEYENILARAYMIVTFPSQPGGYEANIYADSGGSGPGGLIDTAVGGNVVDMGSWNGTSFHLLSVDFDFGALQLGNGVYWFNPVGLGNGNGDDRAFWGTSGAGQVHKSEGYFISTFFGFNNWTPVTQVLGSATDFAFTITADKVPAPGALALLGLAGLVSRRRRA